MSKERVPFRDMIEGAKDNLAEMARQKEDFEEVDKLVKRLGKIIVWEIKRKERKHEGLNNG